MTKFTLRKEGGEMTERSQILQEIQDNQNGIPSGEEKAVDHTQVYYGMLVGGCKVCGSCDEISVG